MIKKVMGWLMALRHLNRTQELALLSQSLTLALAQSNLRIDSLEARLPETEQQMAKVQNRISEYDSKTREIQQELACLAADQQDLRRDWRATLITQEKTLLAAARAMAEQPRRLDVPSPRFANREALYRSFEDAHHLEWKVRERKAFYLPDAIAACQRLQGRPLLDIGCGRGEWLSLLRKADVPSRGVDINPAMAQTARAEGLDIVIGDGLDYLRRQEAGSLAAISAFHLIEHLPFDQVLQMLDDAWRALAPGGLLILETPNPENFMVGACNFWMDPTHLRPLPPELVRFHTEASGYEDIRLRRFRLQEDLHDSMTENEPAPSALRPDEWLNAAYDYGVLARKPLPHN